MTLTYKARGIDVATTFDTDFEDGGCRLRVPRVVDAYLGLAEKINKFPVPDPGKEVT